MDKNQEPVEIRLLGSLRVRRADSSVVDASEWRTGKTLDLLRLLALDADQPVRIDSLLEKLWPDVDEARGRASLRTAASQIRRTLRTDCVARRLGGLVLTNAWVDVTAFRDLAVEARVSRRSGDHARVVGLTREAEAVYLGDFEAHDSGSSWAVETRESLSAMRRSLLTDAAESAVELSWMRDAIDLAESAIAADPYSERAYRALMAAFAGLGETDSALRVFNDVRTVLADELGVTPSRQTTALQMNILSAPDRDDVVPSWVGRDRGLLGRHGAGPQERQRTPRRAGLRRGRRRFGPRGPDRRVVAPRTGRRRPRPRPPAPGPADPFRDGVHRTACPGRGAPPAGRTRRQGHRGPGQRHRRPRPGHRPHARGPGRADEPRPVPHGAGDGGGPGGEPRDAPSRAQRAGRDRGDRAVRARCTSTGRRPRGEDRRTGRSRGCDVAALAVRGAGDLDPLRAGPRSDPDRRGHEPRARCRHPRHPGAGRARCRWTSSSWWRWSTVRSRQPRCCSCSTVPSGPRSAPATSQMPSTGSRTSVPCASGVRATSSATRSCGPPPRPGCGRRHDADCTTGSHGPPWSTRATGRTTGCRRPSRCRPATPPSRRHGRPSSRVTTPLRGHTSPTAGTTPTRCRRPPAEQVAVLRQLSEVATVDR